ncbi:MAG TPA: tetratricopeptide repeat protein [Pirellulales bacterium]|nr:tetratricopeptide repeat protein [Pirellulales bacterium]
MPARIPPRSDLLGDEIATLHKILAERPRWAPAHFALAQAFERCGDWPRAIEHYRRAIEIKPHCVEAHEALAAVLARHGKLADARRHYEQAAVLAPHRYDIHNDLGTVLQEIGDVEAAIASYERALAIAPECVEAHVNVAAARIKLRRFEEAVAGLERASELHPDSAEIHNRLVHALLPLGRTADVKRRSAAVIRLQPDRALWRLRHDLLGPIVFNGNAEIDEFQDSLTERLDKYRGERLKFDVNELPISNCQPPVELIYQGRDDLAIRRSLASIFENSLPTPPRLDRRAITGPPRLAFFVTKGSEAIFLRGMAGVLTRLTPGRFRTTVVCALSGVAKFRAALSTAPIDVLPMAPTLSEMVAEARRAQFDLAYFWEVGTDSLSYFLPFFRLARVQCTSWGWPVTSGIAAMDCFLSSELLEPPDSDAHYNEQLMRLANIPNYYSRPTSPVPGANRERFGLSADQHIYVCAQNPAKIQPDFDVLAGEILRRDPSGVLVIIEARWPAVTAAIRERFARQFPDCANRLKLVGRMVQTDYLTLLATADVVLDTIHYSGGANSVYDALSVGAPVVTLPGRFHRGRYTLAAYRTMGIASCIAKSAEDYIQLAVALANDAGGRRAVVNEIAATRGALFDNTAAGRELEDVLENLAFRGR